jgi:hypothetical protein
LPIRAANESEMLAHVHYAAHLRALRQSLRMHRRSTTHSMASGARNWSANIRIDGMSTIVATDVPGRRNRHDGGE